MKKVLITGSSGFIGNKVSTYFNVRGYNVLGLNRSECYGEFPIQKVDLLNENEIIEVLCSFQPDIIIHCAGSADVGKSVKNPIMDYEGNVTITHNLMFAIHRLGLENVRFVFPSSAGIYGNPESLPITEDMSIKPLSPYAVHKVMCEDLCKYFSVNYGMDIKVARIFSAYGAGLRKQIFWDMYNKYKTTERLDMFGTGNESRDYIHVDDVVQALYILATKNCSDVFYNVANGEEVTIREATEMFADCIGAPRNCIAFNGVVREGDPLNWKADIGKIKNLGYKKSVNMKDGIASYIEWVEKQG